MKKRSPTKKRRESRATFKNPPTWLYQALTGGTESSSGISVSEMTALNLSVVWACVRVISETIGSLPWITYKRTNDDGRERAKKHELYSLLHNAPNSEMPAMVWKETSLAHVLLWGNSYSLIGRNRSDAISELYPVTPDRVTPKRRESGQIFYEISQADGGPKIVEAEDMFHVPGLGFDGVVGYSVVQKARESMGMSSAAEQLGSSFFGNGAQIGGTLEHPGKLSDKARENLRASVKAKHQGSKNAGSMMLLEEGMKYTRIGVPPQDAQFLETRQFQVEEICRWFRVPPHKVQHLLRSTFSNIEHQSIEFVQDTIRPWCVRFEQFAQLKLVRPSEQNTVYTEHLLDALLRGDAISRSQALQLQFQNGALTLDEWRAIENRNPVPEGLGKKHFVTQQQVPLDRIDELVDAKAAPKPAPGNDDAAQQVQRHLDGVRERLGDQAAARESRRLAALLNSNLEG